MALGVKWIDQTRAFLDDLSGVNTQFLGRSTEAIEKTVEEKPTGMHPATHFNNIRQVEDFRRSVAVKGW